MKKLLISMLLAACTFAAKGIEADSLRYVSARTFRIVGKAFSQTESFYDRLPAVVKDSCREELWTLSTNSAGMAIRFRTNSTAIAAKWTLRQNMHMNHMTGVGIRGVDLYRLTDDGWHFVGVGKPAADKECSAVIIENMAPEEAEYMLYLPLYDGVSDVEIGVDAGASIEMPKVDSPRAGITVVFYGTSITQGGCANRPGMCYTSIISRMLDIEAINLGFSGNGRLDLYIAEQMATLDPTLYFLDFVPNCTAEMIDDRAVKFIEILREAHPDTPIIMADSYDFPPSMFDLAQRDALDAKTKAMKRVCEHFKNDPNFIFVEGVRYCNDECSVDGVHLTDMGFQAMSEHYARYIEKAIRKASKNR